MSDRYKIVRMFTLRSTHTIKSNLTLEEAQAHCKSPETSSRTCTSATMLRYTKRNGDWFDGYERD